MKGVCRYCQRKIHTVSNDIVSWWVHDDTGREACTSTIATPMGE